MAHRAADHPPAGGDVHFPAITWCHAQSVSTSMGRAAATNFIQRNQPALPDQKDVYLLLGIPNNDVRPVAIADHNTV
jgi:hypothetical protein